jgi:hypothetical protein
LNEQEKKCASHPFTHLDFLIYNKLGKSAVLAVEVDGFEYHKQGARQEERDRMKDKISYLPQYAESLSFNSHFKDVQTLLP